MSARPALSTSPSLSVGALGIPRIQTNRAGHTGEVTNAGHLHLAARVAFSPSSPFCFFFLSFSLTLFSRVRFFPVSLFCSSPVLRPIVFLFSYLPVSLSLSLLFSFSVRLSRGLLTFGNERACTCAYAGCIMYGGSVQCMVNRETPAGLPATCKFSAFKC